MFSRILSTEMEVRDTISCVVVFLEIIVDGSGTSWRRQGMCLRCFCSITLYNLPPFILDRKAMQWSPFGQ